MRRHISMDELARDVLKSATAAQSEKTAAARTASVMTTDMGAALYKLAEELRTADTADLTYADIVKVAEARRAR